MCMENYVSMLRDRNGTVIEKDVRVVNEWAKEIMYEFRREEGLPYL